MRSFSLRNYGALSAILLLGAFLRVYQLGTESFWGDEGASLEFAYLGGPWEIVEQSASDNNPPLYYMFLHYWIMLFGDSEFSVRFPSALCGTLAILAMYEVGRLLFDHRTALMASLILALSPFQVEYSQEARAYSLMALMTLLSFYYFVKLLKERSLSTQAGYVLSTSALMYSHVYGLFVVLAQNAYLAIVFLLGLPVARDEVRAGLVRGWALLQALLFLLYVPGFVLLAVWVYHSERRGWIPSPSLDSVYITFVTYSGSPLLLALLLAPSLLAVVALARSGAGELYMLLSWLLIPLALPVAISFFTIPLFVPRYGIGASLALYLLAAKGIEVASDAASGAFLRGVPRALRTGASWLVAVTVLNALSSGELWHYFDTVEKPRWREVARYVDTHARSGDLVLVEAYQRSPLLFDYYSESELEQESVDPSGDHTAARQTAKERERVWAVHLSLQQSNPPIVDESFFEGSHGPTDRDRYENTYEDVNDLDQGIDLALYERK